MGAAAAGVVLLFICHGGLLSLSLDGSLLIYLPQGLPLGPFFGLGHHIADAGIGTSGASFLAAQAAGEIPHSLPGRLLFGHYRHPQRTVLSQPGIGEWSVARMSQRR